MSHFFLSLQYHFTVHTTLFFYLHNVQPFLVAKCDTKMMDEKTGKKIIPLATRNFTYDGYNKKYWRTKSFGCVLSRLLKVTSKFISCDGTQFVHFRFDTGRGNIKPCIAYKYLDSTWQNGGFQWTVDEIYIFKYDSS